MNKPQKRKIQSYWMEISKNKLFNEAKKYVDKKNLVKLDFLDAVNYSTTNYKDAAIFIVGSFYVYKDITNFLKGMWL